MKRCLVVVALLALPVASEAGDIDPAAVQLWDVVYTTDGSVLKGVIVEEVPGANLRISLLGGTSLVVPMANVVKKTRELNPGFAVTAAAAPTAGNVGNAGVASAAAPTIVASSGLRIAILPGIAVHDDVSDSTFVLNAKVGWEIALNKWGVTPALALLFAPGTGTYGGESFAAVPSVKAAYRASSVSPFVGFGIGVDVVGGEASLATVMSAGVELVVHKRVALVGEGTFHRGFGGTYTRTLYFGSFAMGIEIRL